MNALFARFFAKKPDFQQVRISPANVELRVGSKETLLQAALNQGIAFPHNCRAGGCGECKCRLVKGKVKELTDKSYILSAEELRDNYVLACQSIPQGDIEVEVSLLEDGSVVPTQHMAGTLQRLMPLTHDILHLVVELEKPLTFIPGYYCELSAQQGSAAGVGRNYSFANVPDADGTSKSVEFFIRKVPGGRFTEWLFSEARVGDEIKVDGPFGDFFLHEASAPMLCVAGGSGLAPVLSMLQGALQSLKKPRDVTLFFGARTQHDLYMLDAIEALRSEWPVNFTFVPVLSSEPEDSDWQGRRGLIGEHFADVLGAALSDQHAYMCGPPVMIDSCAEHLDKAGVLESNIHSDKFLDQSHLGAIKQVS
jgi:NAD(P)H-flavin reductase/ferredoxin